MAQPATPYVFENQLLLLPKERKTGENRAAGYPR